MRELMRRVRDEEETVTIFSRPLVHFGHDAGNQKTKRKKLTITRKNMFTVVSLI